VHSHCVKSCGKDGVPEFMDQRQWPDIAKYADEISKLLFLDISSKGHEGLSG